VSGLSLGGFRPWRRAWFAPLATLLAVYALFVFLAPETFGRAVNLATMLRQTTVVAIAAVGMTFIIIQGGIDLSVGSMVALTTVVVAWKLKQGSSVPVALLLGIAVVTACGALNGLGTTALRITPFIVTLGSMTILRGAAKGLANEQKIDADIRGLDALVTPPENGLLPPGVYIAVAIALAGAALLHYTRFGRHVFAIGSNEATAKLCGVPVERTKILVYALGGALAGIAGLMELATLTVGDPTDSEGLELQVIAAVVVGGASLSGGEGSIGGALVGAFLMTVIKTGCTHLGIPNWVQHMLTGAIILTAAALDRFRRRSSR
jgi:ribose/xylose/arabinose/galactoside ABC-type transport system permease subunit